MRRHLLDQLLQQLGRLGVTVATAANEKDMRPTSLRTRRPTAGKTYSKQNNDENALKQKGGGGTDNDLRESAPVREKRWAAAGSTLISREAASGLDLAGGQHLAESERFCKRHHLLLEPFSPFSLPPSLRLQLPFPSLPLPSIPLDFPFRLSSLRVSPRNEGDVAANSLSLDGVGETHHRRFGHRRVQHKGALHLTVDDGRELTVTTIVENSAIRQLSRLYRNHLHEVYIPFSLHEFSNR